MCLYMCVWSLLPLTLLHNPLLLAQWDSAPVTGLYRGNKRDSILIVPAKKEGLIWSNGVGVGDRGKECLRRCSSVREISERTVTGLVLDFCLLI